MSSKRLIVCADDYAQNETISEGILDLAQTHRIHALSCMVTSPYWSHSAAKLSTLSSEVKTGLHFNLTHGVPLSPQWGERYGLQFPSLGQLFQLIFTGRLEFEIVLAELIAQWERYIQERGMCPDFIDGHQHIHQYAIIRQAVCHLLIQQQYQGWCRISTNGMQDLFAGSFPKPFLMWLLGGRTLKSKLQTTEVTTNPSFAGFYPFHSTRPYRYFFRKFLAQTKPGGLIMCHPGKPSQDKEDPLHRFRQHEYSYLMSQAYQQDLKEFGFET